MATATAHVSETPNMLHGITANDITTAPYAHLVRENALSPQVYATLESEFPSLTQMLGGRSNFGSNEAIRLSVRQVLGNTQVTPLWKEFFAFHTSQEYWRDIVRL